MAKVDEGIETISLVLCLKIKYPTQVYMLRGNHEDGNTSMSYGFYDECINRFNAYKEGDQLWRKFIDVFNMLPLAALISNTIFCVHGGLSPFFGTFDDIDKNNIDLVVRAHQLTGEVCFIFLFLPELFAA
uniref:Serine/threonine-protein phosphatase n=1 Tax=Ascaris lumbricoides TaxID=6252 RepID=A0A0M3HZE6_ASCLU